MYMCVAGEDLDDVVPVFVGPEGGPRRSIQAGICMMFLGRILSPRCHPHINWTPSLKDSFTPAVFVISVRATSGRETTLGEGRKKW